MLTLGSISLAILGCGNQESESGSTIPENTSQKALTRTTPDLSEAIEKRIEGKPEDAVRILRKLNDEHPNS